MLCLNAKSRWLLLYLYEDFDVEKLTTTTEARAPWSHTLQGLGLCPLQREAHTLQRRVAPAHHN